MTVGTASATDKRNGVEPRPKSLKEAILRVIASRDEPSTKPDVDEGLRKLGFPFGGNSVHSALYQMKEHKLLYVVGDGKPMRYIDAARAEDLIAHMDDKPSEEKEPIGMTQTAEAQVAIKAPVNDPSTNVLNWETPIPERQNTMYLLNEAINQLIVKVAEIQAAPVQPQIILQVDIGEAQRHYEQLIADLRLELVAKEGEIERLSRGRNRAEERLAAIRTAALAAAFEDDAVAEIESGVEN